MYQGKYDFQHYSISVGNLWIDSNRTCSRQAQRLGAADWDIWIELGLLVQQRLQCRRFQKNDRSPTP